MWYPHMDISIDISMDLSMDIHIHGNPGFSRRRWLLTCAVSFYLGSERDTSRKAVFQKSPLNYLEISTDISIVQPKCDIHTWIYPLIYPWIYPWISISTATLGLVEVADCWHVPYPSTLGLKEILVAKLSFKSHLAVSSEIPLHVCERSQCTISCNVSL